MLKLGYTLEELKPHYQNCVSDIHTVANFIETNTMKFNTVIAVALAILMAISKADPPTIEVGNPPNHEVRIKF